MDGMSHTATRSLNQIIDEAASIARNLKGHKPKDPHAIARLLTLWEESALAVTEFCRRAGLTASVLYDWKEGKTSSGKPWPALQAAIAKRQGAALAAAANEVLSAPAAPSVPTATVTVNDTAAARAKALIAEVRGDRKRVRWEREPQAVAEVVRLQRESGMDPSAFCIAADIDRTGKLGAALGLAKRAPQVKKVAKKAVKPTQKKPQPAKRKPPQPAKRKPPHAPPAAVANGITFDGTELRVPRTSPTFRAALLAALGVEQ